MPDNRQRMEAELELLQLEEEDLRLEEEGMRATRETFVDPTDKMVFRPEDRGMVGDIGAGIGLAAAETGFGIKGLLPGGLSEEDERVLKFWRRDVKEGGGAGVTGKVIGELAQLAVPAARMGKLSRGSRIAGETALAAGHGGLKAPGEGKTRGREALESAMFALGGSAVGEGVSKLGRGFSKTRAAQKLIDEGVEVTAGKASKSGIPMVMEMVAGVTPFMARGVQKGQQKAVDQFNTLALNQARPFSDEFLASGLVDASKFAKFDDIGHGAITKLKAMQDEAYDEAWKIAGAPNTEMLIRLLDDTAVMRDMMPASYRMSLNKIDDAIDIAANYQTTDAIKNLNKAIRKGVDTAWKSNDAGVAEVFEGMHKVFAGSLSDDAMKILNEVNSNYGKFKAVQHAASSTKADDLGGVFSGKDLQAGAKNAGKKTRFSEGKAPMQEMARTARETVSSKEPDIMQLRSVLKKAMAKASPDLVGFPSKLLIGENPLQKAAFQKTKALSDALRKIGIDPATVGAAIEE